MVARQEASNGFWLRLLGSLTLAAIIAVLTVLWSHHARIMQVETRHDAVVQRLDRIDGKLDTLIERLSSDGRR